MKLWGAHVVQKEGTNTFALPAPLVFPYPIDEDYSEYEEINAPGLVTISLTLVAIGRGFCIVPPGDAYDTLLIRLLATGYTSSGFSAKALMFLWYDDDGIIRATATTFNIPGEGIERFDEDKLRFTGPASFMALEEII